MSHPGNKEGGAGSMPDSRPPAATWRLLLRIFFIMFRIGLFTFGGGAAMIPMIQREFVEKEKLTDDEQITDVFAVAQSLPGTIAVNTSVLLGYQMAGTAGAIVAGLGCVLPSFLVLCVVSVFYTALSDNPYVTGALRGVRGAVIALLLSAIWKLRRSSMRDAFGWVLFFGALTLAMVFPNLHVVFLLLAGGALGFAFYFRKLKGEKEVSSDDA